MTREQQIRKQFPGISEDELEAKLFDVPLTTSGGVERVTKNVRARKLLAAIQKFPSYWKRGKGAMCAQCLYGYHNLCTQPNCPCLCNDGDNLTVEIKDPDKQEGN